MTKELASIKLLLKNKQNRRWWISNWGKSFFTKFTAFVSVWTLVDVFGISLTKFVESVLPGSGVAVMILAFAVCIVVSGWNSLKELKSFSHTRVETERSGCSVEIQVADSYLTNAFDNYPNSAMIIGCNKAFWFQEAEPGSLIADMWKRLENKGLKKETVQEEIDKALSSLWTKDGKPDELLKATYIDQTRPKVHVKYNGTQEGQQNCTEKCKHMDTCPLKNKGSDTGKFTVCRDNYQIGTVVGVDLHLLEPEKQEAQNPWKLLPGALKSRFQRNSYILTAVTDKLLRAEPKIKPEKPLGFFEYIRNSRYKTVPAKRTVKKLYLIANAEVVQGFDNSEPMKVTFDRNASVVESFPKIWEYFEAEEERTPLPPKHIVYQPLLIPLIGAGVANEGYTDLEIFSKIVDLYYEHLRKSIRAGKHPVIPNLIINIQDKTAIELSGKDSGSSRKIDIKTAFDYLNYRNRVNPVISKD